MQNAQQGITGQAATVYQVTKATHIKLADNMSVFKILTVHPDWPAETKNV